MIVGLWVICGNTDDGNNRAPSSAALTPGDSAVDDKFTLQEGGLGWLVFRLAKITVAVYYPR